MSESQSPSSQPEYELSVEFSEVELFRQLIQRIQLNGGIQRVSLEIESTEPLYKPTGTDRLEAKPDTERRAELHDAYSTAPDSDAESESESESDDEATESPQFTCEECGDSFDTEQGRAIHKGHKHAASESTSSDSEAATNGSLEHLTDQLTDEEEEPEPEPEEKEEENENEASLSPLEPREVEFDEDAIRSDLAVEYLEDTEERGNERPPLEWFEDRVDRAINPDTQKYHVLTLLYRAQGLLKSSQIQAMLEDTEWEMSRSAVTTALSTGKKSGWALNVDGGWQLTQYGRDYLDALVNETPGYDLQVADEVTGRRDAADRAEKVTA